MTWRIWSPVGSTSSSNASFETSFSSDAASALDDRRAPDEPFPQSRCAKVRFWDFFGPRAQAAQVCDIPRIFWFRQVTSLRRPILMFATRSVGHRENRRATNVVMDCRAHDVLVAANQLACAELVEHPGVQVVTPYRVQLVSPLLSRNERTSRASPCQAELTDPVGRVG